jgi:TIR domain
LKLGALDESGSEVHAFDAHREDTKTQGFAFPQRKRYKVDRRTSMTIFISYSRHDSEFVDRLIHELERRGFDAWVDREDIRGGAAWGASISQAIRECQAVIVVLSPRSAASGNVAKELSLADHHKRPIIPLRFEPGAIPAALEFQLAGLQIIEFNRAGFSNSVDQVVQALRALPHPAARRPSEQQIERIQTRQESRTGSLRRKAYWLLASILVVAGLIVTLRQMKIFDRRDRRATLVQRHPAPSAGIVAPAPNRGAGPEAKAGVAYKKVLAVKLDPYKPDKRTLRLSIRVTVGRDTHGIGVGRNYFRLLVDGLALPPTKYPSEPLRPQTSQDFEVEFVIPKTATQLALQLGDVRGETEKIPIDPSAVR